MPTYTIIDTETTGLVRAKACEIAWIIIDEDLRVLDAQVFLTDPQQPIEEGAFNVHGISQEKVTGLPDNAAICSMIPKPVVWIGHNSSYDVGVIGEHVEYTDELCTLALSRRWVKGTPNHKLTTLKEHLKLSAQDSHSALGDCYSTLDLLRFILPICGRTLAQLVDLERAPKMLNTMPFGMHRGKAFSDIPKAYREWLLERTIPKDLRYTLEKMRIL